MVATCGGGGQSWLSFLVFFIFKLTHRNLEMIHTYMTFKLEIQT